jgi:flavin-dependent dehydrogenase
MDAGSHAPAREAQVLVVGGGLAGLSATIAAARRGREVVLCESSGFGRDKVCGEFLSPEAAADLEALGCGDWIDVLRPAPMRNVLLCSPRGARLAFDLPGPPAWSCTRRALESFLAERARAAGAVLHERAPVKQLTPVEGAWRWRAGDHEGVASTTIAAFGKRSTLDAALELPRASAPEPFAAVKTYFAPQPGALEADVELHVFPGGYVGLNAVEDGRIGMCALLDGNPTTHWDEIMQRFAANEVLRTRLERLGAPASPVRGLARFGFGAQRLVHHDGDSVALLTGDAARMMPSFTGDGMAVALHSGRLAAEALADANPDEAYEQAYAHAFVRRLRVANVLHTIFFRPSIFAVLAPMLSRSPRTVERLYEWTRGLSLGREAMKRAA